MAENADRRAKWEELTVLRVIDHRDRPAERNQLTFTVKFRGIPGNMILSKEEMERCQPEALRRYLVDMAVSNQPRFGALIRNHWDLMEYLKEQDQDMDEW